MTPEERARLNYLCEIVATEKDPKKFESCVEELLALIAEKRKRFHAERQSKEG